jgi:hypothetical protein
MKATPISTPSPKKRPFDDKGILSVVQQKTSSSGGKGKEKMTENDDDEDSVATARAGLFRQN